MSGSARRITLVLALVLGASVARAQGVSPGELATDHKSLEGTSNCTRCHSSGDRIGTERCLGCHRALGRRIAAKAGYHGKVAGDCASCHPEHRGRSAALVRWPGPGGQAAFDHARLAGFALAGAHARTSCRGCHKPTLLRGDVAPLLSAAERPRTFLGLGRACVSCHSDPHQPSLGTACQGCHDEATWAGAVGRFDHAKARFALRGAHAKVACEKCHPAQGSGAPKLKGLKFDTCTGCHESPHAAQIGGPTTCTQCHDEAAWKALPYLRAKHAPVSAPLRGGHATTTCVACHGDKLSKPIKPACATCHDDAHRPSLGTRCEGCHDVASWSGSGKAPAPSFHDRTSFPLRGRHASQPCAVCHDPRKPKGTRFRPIAHDRCELCHPDPHAGELRSRPDGGRCDSCHDEDGWRPPRFDLADHASTRFALTGGHGATACTACHPPRPAPSPGFRRADLACAGCHADPHQGQFAPRSCDGCHDSAAWAPSRYDAAAHAKTGFLLAGKHAVACARCHGGGRFVATARACGACHEDAHRGQLAARACQDCHAGAEFAPAPGFRHDDTRLPLHGAHASAACKRCHPTVPLARQPTVIYALGTTRCQDCHGSGHGDAAGTTRQQRLAEATQDCTGCHAETVWSALSPAGAHLDHALTGVPLLGGHARAPCARCHVAARATPAMTSCASCHADRHDGRLGERCERCHSPRSWRPDGLLTDHRRTRLPLVGMHAVQGCERCHASAAAGDFGGLDASCQACHQHTVSERRPHPTHSGDAFARCGDCHDSLGWRPANFNHDRFFALTGRHQSVACARCHAGGRYAGTPRACVGCHAGEDDARSVVDHARFASRDACERCHNTTAWKPAQFPDHDLFYPLRGDHRSLTCAQCHLDPGDIRVFTCTMCHAHEEARMAAKHREERDYVWESGACLRCHRNGRGGD